MNSTRGSNSTLKLWTQGPMRRIFPDTQPPSAGAGTLLISAARGETECFQVGVRFAGLSVNYLRAEIKDLKRRDGMAIAADNVDLLYPEFVPVKWPCADQVPGDVERVPPAFFPDPLLTEWPFDVCGPTTPPTRSVWVRIRVPRDAPPGVYRGTITVRCGQKSAKAENQADSASFEKTERVSFRLRVWDFELPQRSRLLMTNWLFHDVLADWFGLRLWSPEYWRLIERVADNMAAHRQNVIWTPLVFGKSTAEDQLIGVRRSGKTLTFDFSGLDRWCRIFFDRGFELIEGECFADIKSGTAVTYWETGATTAKRVTFKNTQDPRFTVFLRQFFHALWQHLAKRGWRGKYIQHISDEPSVETLERYRTLVDAVRAAAPGIKIIEALSDPAYASLVDYPVPLECAYQRLCDEGKRAVSDVWMYYCCGPTGAWPNRFVEYPLIRVRIFSWVCFQKNIPGFLHWGYNFWSAIRKSRHNPWDDCTTHRHPGGDGCIVYPPRDEQMSREQVVDSIRWEIIREAMEDYEYLRMTQELAETGNAAARAILHDIETTVVLDWTSHTRDAALLESVRERMGDLLSAAGRRNRGATRNPRQS